VLIDSSISIARNKQKIENQKEQKETSISIPSRRHRLIKIEIPQSAGKRGWASNIKK
jgi:hypothetical protein